MHDWTGSVEQLEATTIPCAYCHAPVGEPCVRDGQPLRAFPAHDVRIRASKAVQA